MLVKKHELPNGDLLILEAVNTFVGMHGLMVYTVSYASKDGGEYQGVGSEPYMTKDEALTAFNKRVTSEDPSKPSREHGGIHEIVVDAFRRYLGDGLLRPPTIPKDWARFFNHVKEMTIARDGSFYDGEKIHAALDGLDTTSTKHSGGRADTIVEMPAWLVLHMLTTITALGLAVQKSTPPTQSLLIHERAVA